MSIVVLALVLSCGLSFAANKINLSTAIRRMLSSNGELASEKKGLDYAEGRIDQARAALFPKTQIYLLSAPIFEERGNAISSVKNYGKWGIFSNIKATILQPIYTFGVASEYKKAAKHGYEVEIEKVRNKKGELVYRTKQFYYSVQLANDLFDIVKDARKRIEGNIELAEEKVKRDRMKREDLFSLKTYYAEILAKYDEARRGRDLATKALAWILGYSAGSRIELESEYLSPEKVKIKPEAQYLATAMTSRSEVRMLSFGIEATRALWKGQVKQKRPVLFALGFANVAYSNVRNDQRSIFANDPFNDFSGGILLGLKFNLDWWTINAMSKQSKAEYEKLLVSKETMVDGMMLQVKKAYREVIDYKKALDYTKEGERNAKKWFMNAAVGYSMGLSETEKLIDALKGYFEAQLNFYMAVYSYNMALAELTKVTGEEVVSSIEY